MKNKKILRKKIKNDPDFVYCPRLGNSLKKLMDKHPEGIDDERIEKVLLMSKKEIEETYNSALEKLRKSIKE